MGQAVAVQMLPELWDSDPREWLASLPELRARGRDVMVIVAGDPLYEVFSELAVANGFDTFACQTPLDAVDTLVQVGDRVACALVSSDTKWGEAFAHFLADEFPHVQRILVEA